MVLQRTTMVNNEGKDMEDEEENENDKEMSNKGANKGIFFVCN